VGWAGMAGIVRWWYRQERCSGDDSPFASQIQRSHFIMVATCLSHWGQGVVSWAGTSQVHHKDMDKVPGKNPPGTSQVHSEYSQPVSLQCSWVRKWSVNSQCSRSCDQGVPIRNIMGTFKIFLSSSFKMFPVNVTAVFLGQETVSTFAVFQVM